MSKPISDADRKFLLDSAANPNASPAVQMAIDTEAERIRNEAKHSIAAATKSAPDPFVVVQTRLQSLQQFVREAIPTIPPNHRYFDTCMRHATKLLSLLDEAADCARAAKFVDRGN